MAEALPPKERDPDLEKLFSAMSLNVPMIGSDFYAKTAYLFTPHDFYIIPATSMYNLPALCKVGKPIQADDLDVSKTVIFMSKCVKRYVRGTIKNVDGNSYTIYAIDFGFTEENVALKSIFHPLNEEAMTIPSLAMHCELYLCAPYAEDFTVEAIDAFKYYMGDMDQEKLKVHLHARTGNKYIVTVFNSCPDDMSTMLCITGFTCFLNKIRNNPAPLLDETSTSEVQTPTLSYRHRKTRVGQTLDVRVQYGKLGVGGFYVIPTKYYDKYYELSKDFHQYCKTLDPMTFEDCAIGDIVGARYQNMYSRASITGLEGERVNVKLVDLGVDITVDATTLKRVKSIVFTKDAVYCIYCAGDPNFKPKNHGLEWYYLHKGYTFRITIEKIGNGFETPNIVSISKIV